MPSYLDPPVVGQLLRFFAQANRDIFGINGAPVHDALAVASIINPDVIKTENLHVGIETRGTLTRGQTVVDVHKNNRQRTKCRNCP